MPLPQDIVPKLLIPFFQNGVMKQLLDIASNFGTGLNLFNALRRAWPRDPALDVATYNQLIGWIATFTGRSLRAGAYISQLKPSSPIDTSLIPKNFYLRRPPNSLCNLFVKVHYFTQDTEEGSLFENEGNLFIDLPQDVQGILDQVQARINNDLHNIAATNQRDKLYQIIPGSIQIQAIVRTC